MESQKATNQKQNIKNHKIKKTYEYNAFYIL